MELVRTFVQILWNSTDTMCPINSLDGTKVVTHYVLAVFLNFPRNSIIYQYRVQILLVIQYIKFHSYLFWNLAILDDNME